MLPTPTKEGKRVKIFKVNDHEMYQKMDYYHFVSYAVWLQEISIAEDECSGDIYVCDIGDFVLSDVLRFTPMLLKKISLLSQVSNLPINCLSILSFFLTFAIGTFFQQYLRYIFSKLSSS